MASPSYFSSGRILRIGKRFANKVLKMRTTLAATSRLTTRLTALHLPCEVDEVDPH
ncbi:hypothetical protein [Nocardioides convexus]|uniref:hypothetical protein n=1 Tax=Nocardioides convexus TaxID=2712224 RepID=UPI0024183621|nr:hypothetical protein [Nocardioides convexus]